MASAFVFLCFEFCQIYFFVHFFSLCFMIFNFVSCFGWLSLCIGGAHGWLDVECLDLWSVYAALRRVIAFSTVGSHSTLLYPTHTCVLCVYALFCVACVGHITHHQSVLCVTRLLRSARADQLCKD